MNGTNEQQTLDILGEDELKEAFEAVLFAAGYPLTFEKLSETFGKTDGEMRLFAEEFSKEYNSARRGILMLVMEDCCQLCTKEQYKDYARTALGIKSSGKLSNSCLEALAIVAYNQPVTKAYIEQVRGVDCSWAVGMLCDKALIEPKGRLDAPGKPILYGTTDEFLRVFGLRSIADLPKDAVLPEAKGEQTDIRSASDGDSGT
ncbi:MAG: SMC-Scp complex subunit ScpB [Clostridia bacterium]|nr:SMC-Scp complex subunit ScpB [Clostridia bacterium]